MNFRKVKHRMKQLLNELHKSSERVYDESGALYDETNSLIYNTEDLLASPHWQKISRGLRKSEELEQAREVLITEVEARLDEQEREIAEFKRTWLGKLTTTTEEQS